MQTHYLGEVETYIILCSKYIQDNSSRILSESDYFVDDVTKTFGVFFRFVISIVVHLQNANAKFQKVV